MYSAYYGGLGAVAVLMVWLWLMSACILLGAELNAQLERQADPPVDSLDSSGPPPKTDEIVLVRAASSSSALGAKSDATENAASQDALSPPTSGAV